MNQKKIGVILTYINLGINFLTGLVYTPFMLLKLGENEYGVYQLVYSIVTNLSLLSFGFDSSYIRFFSRYKVKGEKDEIRKMNGMYMILFCTISFICFILGILMILNSDVVLGNKISKDEYKIARRLMVLMIINIMLMFPNSVFDCYISANEKFIFQRFINLLYSIMSPLCSIPLLLLGYGSIGLVGITTALTLIKLFSNIYFAMYKLKMQFSFRNMNLKLFREMGNFTVFIFVNQIIDMINWNLDKYLLGRMIGSVSVAVYSVGAEINNIYMQLSVAISRVFIPQVNRLANEDDGKKKLSKLMTRVGSIQYQVLMLILLGFIFWGKEFIFLWVGKGYEQTYYVVLLLIGSAIIPFFQNIGIEIQRAYNRHQIRTIVYSIMALMNVMLTIIFIPRFGVWGASLGTAIAIVIGNVIFMNWYYVYKMKLDMLFFWKRIITFLPYTIAMTIFGLILKKCVHVNSWFTLFFSATLFTLVYATVLWLVGLKKEERIRIRSRFLR